MARNAKGHPLGARGTARQATHRRTVRRRRQGARTEATAAPPEGPATERARMPFGPTWDPLAAGRHQGRCLLGVRALPGSHLPIGRPSPSVPSRAERPTGEPRYASCALDLAASGGVHVRRDAPWPSGGRRDRGQRSAAGNRTHADSDDRAWAHHAAYPDYLARTKIRMDVGIAARYAREAIRMLVSVHGASSFATANPLQRICKGQPRAADPSVVHTISTLGDWHARTPWRSGRAWPRRRPPQ